MNSKGNIRTLVKLVPALCSFFHVSLSPVNDITFHDEIEIIMIMITMRHIIQSVPCLTFSFLYLQKYPFLCPNINKRSCFISNKIVLPILPQAFFPH